MLLSSVVLIVLGLFLAFAGRRFISLVVGLAGFVLGYNLVTFFIPDQVGVFQLIMGVVFGLIGYFLASRFVRILLMVAGFILIGNAVLAIGTTFGVDNLFLELLLFVGGGVLGLVLVLFAFDLSIIIISALGGASMVMNGLPGLLDTEPGTLNLLIGIAIAVAGFVVQWRFLKAPDQKALK